MDAFEKWWVSDEAWQCHCDWCDDHDNHLVSFRAGMRCAADIAFSLAIKSDKVYTAGDVRASILAEADK